MRALGINETSNYLLFLTSTFLLFWKFIYFSYCCGRHETAKSHVISLFKFETGNVDGAKSMKASVLLSSMIRNASSITCKSAIAVTLLIPKIPSSHVACLCVLAVQTSFVLHPDQQCRENYTRSGETSLYYELREAECEAAWSDYHHHITWASFVSCAFHFFDDHCDSNKYGLHAWNGAAFYVQHHESKWGRWPCR